MKRKFWLLALVGVVLLGSAPVLADDGFYVIAGGGGVGTRITSLPYTISAPGFYYLGGNLRTSITSSSASAITVNADNVTLDLMGFDLLNTSGLAAGNGIYMYGRLNVEIRNGTVRGFNNGILENHAAGAKHRVSHVRAIANVYGIVLHGSFHLVNACTGANGTGGIEIDSGMVTGSVASDNSDYGIYLGSAGSLIGNVASSNGTTGFKFGADVVLVDRNSASNNGTNYSSGGGSTAWGVNAGK